MQTMERGKHVILPVPGLGPKHARMPVMLPRTSDADMRRNGSNAAQPGGPTKPLPSAEECTAHQRPTAETRSSEVATTRRSPWPDVQKTLNREGKNDHG